MSFRFLALTVGACATLAACGTNPTDRAFTGAGLGAAAGAVIGAVAGGPILGAVVVGTAIGAVAGGVTNAKTIDLGPAPWH